MSTAAPATPFDFVADEARVLANPRIAERSRIEGGLIASIINARSLRSYIDLGCWYGVLAREVLAACGPGCPEHVLLADACHPFLSAARRTVNPRVPETLHAAIVPCGEAWADARLALHPTDTSSSSVRAGCGGADDGTGDSVPTVTVTQLLERLPAEWIASAYLKIDLEGLDEAIVRDLIASAVRPAVLHFEFLPAQWSDPGTFEFIRAAGYRVPVLPRSPAHMYYSVICGREDAGVVGFRPDIAYPGL
jgi:hypothetical protein